MKKPTFHWIPGESFKLTLDPWWLFLHLLGPQSTTATAATTATTTTAAAATTTTASTTTTAAATTTITTTTTTVPRVIKDLDFSIR